MPKNPFGSSLLVLVILLAGCRSGKTTTIDFADGSYEGEIDGKGRKDGKGTYRWNDGSTYVGDFNRYADSEFRYADKSDDVAIDNMVRDFARTEEAKRRYLEGKG